MEIICTLKDLHVAHRLDYDVHNPQELFELILDQVVFVQLWNKGFFSQINQVAGSNIDGFEDEVITYIKRI